MKRLRFSRRLRFGFLAATMLGATLASVGFAAAQSVNAPAIARGFETSEQTLVQGALVSTTAGDANAVELASTSSANRLTGIVSQDALVELSSGDEANTQVILSGTALALVSDINGTIKAGDKITASPVSGVGMLATEDAQVIGTAQSDFKADDAQEKSITDKNGQRQNVRIGRVPLQIAISYYVAPTSDYVPPFLQNAANSIAGRPVSFIRIVMSCLLLLLAFGTIFVLIYTAVRSGIISLGRNPLAAGAIQRGLLGVVGIVLLITAAAFVGIYLFLTL